MAMGTFEDMCNRILNKVEILATNKDIPGILGYIKEMRREVAICSDMQKSEGKYIDTLVENLN